MVFVAGMIGWDTEGRFASDTRSETVASGGYADMSF